VIGEPTEGKALRSVTTFDEFFDHTQGSDDAVSGDRFDPSPAWSPDGAKIAYTERARELLRWQTEDPKLRSCYGPLKGPPDRDLFRESDRGGAWAIDMVALSPDGKTLTIVLQDSGWDKVYLLPAEGGQPKQLTQGEWEDRRWQSSRIAIVSKSGTFGSCQ
jgi:Tol biopolymer transport system component